MRHCEAVEPAPPGLQRRVADNDADAEYVDEDVVSREAPGAAAITQVLAELCPLPAG